MHVVRLVSRISSIYQRLAKSNRFFYDAIERPKCSERPSLVFLVFFFFDISSNPSERGKKWAENEVRQIFDICLSPGPQVLLY